jgi:hypothetical protein
MSVSTYTRKAKCKDCVFIFKYYVGNKKVHKCSNVYSERSEKHVRLNDFVCSKWSLIYKQDENE